MQSKDEETAMGDMFRRAMRSFAGNVSVITVGRDDDRSGLVATSAVSLSVEPAMMLVCVNRGSSSWPLFERYRHFGVNALRPDQQAIAEQFSGRGGIRGVDRYALGDWRQSADGAPLLTGAVVAMDCAVDDIIQRETHAILIGKVLSVTIGDADASLVYWHGAYRPLSLPDLAG